MQGKAIFWSPSTISSHFLFCRVHNITIQQCNGRGFHAVFDNECGPPARVTKFLVSDFEPRPHGRCQCGMKPDCFGINSSAGGVRYASVDISVDIIVRFTDVASPQCISAILEQQSDVFGVRAVPAEQPVVAEQP